MFGLSLSKLLLLALVILIVWFGWKKLERLAGTAKQMARRRPGNAPSRDAPPRAERPAAAPDEPETVDLAEDPVTGRFEPVKRDRKRD